MDTLQAKKEDAQKRLNHANRIAGEIECFVKKRIKLVKGILSVIACLLLWVACITYKEDEGVLSFISIGASIWTWILTLWGKDNVVVLSLIPKVEGKIREKRRKLLHFSEDELLTLQREITELTSALREAKEKANGADNRLKIERAKMVKFSVDLTILEG